MSKTTDIVALATLVERLLAQAMNASKIVRTMHAEGRKKLTPEEAKSLQTADDLARQDQLDALEEARAEEAGTTGEGFGHLV